MNRAYILHIFLLMLTICCCSPVAAQKAMRLKWKDSGVLAIGLRSGIVLANSSNGLNEGQGMGVQARLMATSHINTEWFFEYFHGGFTNAAVRTDGHIGATVLLYPQHRLQRVTPFLAVGPNADYIRLHERINKANAASRWSLAAHSGMGMHINLTRRTDMTISALYMLHFGSELKLPLEDATLLTVPDGGKTLDGHFIINLSFNYKIADLWKRLRL